MMDRWFVFEGGPHREVISKGSVTMAFCCFTVESLLNWFISTNSVFVFIPDKVNSWYNNIYKMKFQILTHCYCLHNRCYTNALLFGKMDKTLTYIYPKILELSLYNICEVYDQKFINSLKIIEKQFYRDGLLRNCRETEIKNYTAWNLELAKIVVANNPNEAKILFDKIKCISKEDYLNPNARTISSFINCVYFLCLKIDL